MFSRQRQGGFLSIACAMGIFIVHPVLADDAALLPSLELQNAIRELPVMTKEKRTAPEPPYLTLQVNRGQTTSTDLDGASLDDAGAAAVPFVTPNVMILQFEPSVSADEIQNYVRNHNLKVVQTFPEIGAILVEVDLHSYVQLESTDDGANERLLSGLVKAIDDFQNDPLIRLASPDLLLSGE